MMNKISAPKNPRDKQEWLLKVNVLRLHPPLDIVGIPSIISQSWFAFGPLLPNPGIPPPFPPTSFKLRLPPWSRIPFLSRLEAGGVYYNSQASTLRCTKTLALPPSLPSSRTAVVRETFIHPLIPPWKPSHRTSTPRRGKGGALAPGSRCSPRAGDQLFHPSRRSRASSGPKCLTFGVVRARARLRGLRLLLVPRGAVRTCPGGNGDGARSPHRPRVRGKIRR